MRVMSRTRPCPGADWIRSLLCLTLLLWTRRVTGLSDFSNYLSRILTSHSAHACDGTPLRLHCPRHSTISIQSAFYGSGEVWPCRVEPPLRHHNHSCAAFTALQKLLSECQSHRDCELPVNHLLFGKDPCPGTTKYLHVEYKCKPAEHKRLLVCEGETMLLHCKPPRVLNIYAAVYGRRLGQTDTCPSHLSRPPPFECLNHEALHRVSKSCYSKQKCAVTVGNQTFRDPCFPGTRKYLSVLYSCGGTLLCFLILKLLLQGDTFEKDFKIRADSHNVMIGLRHPGFLFWPFFSLCHSCYFRHEVLSAGPSCSCSFTPKNTAAGNDGL